MERKEIIAELKKYPTYARIVKTKGFNDAELELNLNQCKDIFKDRV